MPNNLEFAISREIDGEKYYLEQAEFNKGNALSTVFLSLAKDEENHAVILRNKGKEMGYELEESQALSNSKTAFKKIRETDAKMPIVPIQLEIYKIALEKEKQSIELYEKFLAEANDEKSKKLFEYLLKQEQEHFSIIEEMIILISHTEDWVESPEFGVREEY